MLEVKNVSAGYGEVEVLHDVSLKVNEGEIVALVGANAAGKTTLLSALSGLVKIKTGEILFDGKPMNNVRPHKIVELGLVQVPEGRHLFPFMTVLENILLGGINKRALSSRNSMVKDIWDLLPILEERKHQLAGSLSGGEAQMCAIARGLMACPKMLMFDEPSLGLAPKAVKSSLDLISGLKAKGITVLLVEQNVRASLQIANRAYVLENGNIVLQGSGLELLDNEDVKRAYLGI